MIHQQGHRDLYGNNRFILCLLALRYLVIYLPLIYWGDGFETNTEPYDIYITMHYVGRAIFIGASIFCLSFFTSIKELRQFIYYRAICEFFEAMKLLFVMCAIENFVIHESKTWEWKLSIFVNIAAAAYLFIKWKKNQTT